MVWADSDLLEPDVTNPLDLKKELNLTTPRADKKIIIDNPATKANKIKYLFFISRRKLMPV